MAVSFPSPSPAAPAVAASPDRTPGGAPGPPAAPARAAGLLLAGLLVAALYAAFAGGAAGVHAQARLQVGLAVLGLLAAAAWLGARRLRPAAEPLSVAGVVALALLAAWAGASLALWSVAPDRSWGELNRLLVYALAAALALVVGSTLPRAAQRLAAGWVVVAVLVALYALAGKVLPGVVDDALVVARLRSPLEYGNALGLVCALGAVVALRLAAQPEGRPGGRIAALVALFVLGSALGMTSSGDAVLALVVGVVVLTASGGPRLRGLGALALAALAATPGLVLALGVRELADDDVVRHDRITAGLLLGVVLLAMAVLLAAAGRLALRLEARRTVSAPAQRRVWLGLAGVLVALAVAGVAVLATGAGGIGGALDRARDDVTRVRAEPALAPSRPAPTEVGNRWSWWQEAFGAWADEPVRGWGADAFAVSRRLYRASPDDAQRAHSLPLQWLADLGLVGALLGGAALALLAAGAVVRLRRLPPGRERDVGAALLAGAAAYLVHALADRDWQVPGVTLPLVLFLGVLGGRPPRPRPALLEQAGEGRGPRVIALAAVALVLCAVAASGVLPAWSDARTDAALSAAADPQRLDDAAADAALAARLDPTAVRPLLAGASIAQRRGRLLEARGRLLDAVARQPASVESWVRLAQLGVRLADREGARRALDRALALDPADPGLERLVRARQAVVAPPEASATATGTPLPPAPVAAPAAPITP